VRTGLRKAILGYCLVLNLWLFAFPPEAEAQQAGKAYQIGYLAVSPRPTDEVFRQALRELGYVEGQNLTILWRWGQSGDYAPLVEDLMRSKVDLIVAVTSPATRAAKEATKTIPIVIMDVGDPVAYGFVPSLARPGGNITGMSAGLSEIGPKGLQYLKEIHPKAALVAILGNPNNPGHISTVSSVEAAAPSLGLKSRVYIAAKPDDLAETFRAILRDRPDALFVIPDLFLFTQRARIIEFALTNRLPAVYGLKEYVPDGGLIALSPNRDDMFRRAALHVDKILKGAKPSDLPIELPTKFELVINIKTAKALGLAIPQSLRVQAELVE
jgi:putative ABC transport system substrate-binding protein